MANSYMQCIGLLGTIYLVNKNLLLFLFLNNKIVNFIVFS